MYRKKWYICGVINKDPSDMNAIYIPSQERYTIRMEPYEGSTLENCDWEVIAKARHQVIIPKSSAIFVEDGVYDFILDSKKIGPGRVIVELHVHIKDSAAPGGTRLMVKRFQTEDMVVE